MQVRTEYLDPSRIPAYQNGAEGFFTFVEECVRFEVKFPGSSASRWVYPTELPDTPVPETGRSWKQFWESQKEELRPALAMKNGKFRYKVIILCWMRGEGKSLIVVLIQLWKFFCFPRQLIVFGALSKDQTRFVHYDIAQKIILNSPKLLNIIGKNNVQQGRFFLKDGRGEITSSIQPISNFTGIVSNITGYTFSEMFDMKDSKHFVQLDGSTRNIINSLGTIDSTVSTKDHILYHLYKSFINGKDKLLYFSHRAAPEGKSHEFWAPNMDDEQLDSYRSRFPTADFDRYFRNSWELDSGKLFSEALVKSIFYVGYYDKDGIYHKDDCTCIEICNEIQDVYAKASAKDGRGANSVPSRRRRTANNDREAFKNKIAELSARLVPMDDLYSLQGMGAPCLASCDDLRKMSNIYDTNWSIHAGIDRSDPSAKNPQARTIITVVAKGLTGSRSNSNILSTDRDVPEYIYLLLHFAHVLDASLEGIKRELKSAYVEYDGLDTVCSERWGAWDLAPWCAEHEIQFETVFPHYELQKKAFSELFVIIRNARLKSPSIIVPGVGHANLLHEELCMFDSNAQKKQYGSPQKDQQGGVQDDSVYSLGWCIYGGREFGVEDFRERESVSFFGEFAPGPKTHARYSEMES